MNDFSPFLGSNGQTLTLHINDVIHFCTTGSSFCPIEDQHGITLKSIDTNTGSVVVSVVITIASTPTDYTLYLNRPLDIDVDHDGQADIRATLKLLTGSYAEISFISLTSAGPTIHLLALLGVGG